MALLHRNTRTRPVPCCQPGHDVHCAAGGGAHQDRRCGWLLGTRRALNAWIVWPASVSRQAFTLRGEAARRLTRAGERGSGERGGFGGREPSPTVRLSSDVGNVAGSESALADARLDALQPGGPSIYALAALADARLDALQPGGPSIYALADGADLHDPGVAARIRATVERLRAVPGVAEVTDPVTTPPRELAAGDGRAAMVVVEFAPGLPSVCWCGSSRTATSPG